MSITLGTTNPTARTSHRCDFCDRVIAPGERYRRQRVIGDDGPYVYRACRHCQALVGILEYDQLDPYGEGYTGEAMVDYEPRDLAELRLKVLWRKKWRRRDGSLFPVPTRQGAS